MWLEVPVCYPARAGLPRHPPRVVRSSAETAERGDRPDGHRDDLVQDRLELLLREVVFILRSLGPPQLSLLEELKSLVPPQHLAAQRGDDLQLVESERSVHEITIAATAPLGAINELLPREAMISNV